MLTDLHHAFLADTPWHPARAVPIPFDMSDRRYWRLQGGEPPALLMHSPAVHEPVAPYVTIAGQLRDWGLSAPLVYKADLAAGLALVEDFGDTTYARALRAGADRAALYRLAVAVLADLHQRGLPDLTLASYGGDVLQRELKVFTDWALPVLAANASEAAAAEFLACAGEALAPVTVQAGAPGVLVLRDYHIDNLFYLADRKGVARCGLIDFQDALTGLPAYDLVSLLEDARIDVPDDLYRDCVTHYLERMPAADGAALNRDMALLGLQRHLKVVGVFIRYWRRHGSRKYLVHLPRLARLIARAAEHPAAAQVAQSLNRLVPDLTRQLAAIGADKHM